MDVRARQRGFSLIECLIGAALIALAAMGGVAYVVGSSQHADNARDRLFARHKALSILSELRSYVEGGDGEVAADLDGFDDGLSQNATLSIAPDPNDPGAFVAPEHPLSANIADRGEWRWFRRITVRRFPGVNTRDLRICTVRMFRHMPTEPLPGSQYAEVSTVIRTVGDAYPTSQVYDVYLLALENVPGWWVFMDSIKPFVDTTLADLEARNPGLEFRSHWITTAGYGRDEQYAPYTNETRVSTDDTPWAYVYPGRMPSGSASERYYVPSQIRARMNLDGQNSPTFVNDWAPTEPYTDANGNGVRDPGEPYTDDDGDGSYDLGNVVPYALADQHNHCMRWPDENAKFQARVAAGLDRDDVPTMRLLLDRMIADPARFHNAILVNLHGELLPMPAVRNYSDAAKDPVGRPGWRVVTHPERIRPRRTQGSDASSDAPRWRVYAYKTEFPTAEPVMTLREPFRDLNGNGVFDAGDQFVTGAGGDDWNGNGTWDDHCPATVKILGPDHTAAVNAGANPSLLVRRLRGGVDADGVGGLDAYSAFANAPQYPEAFTDGNGDGRRNVVEPYFDRNVNGVYDAGTDAHLEVDGDGVRTGATEALVDGNGNSVFDRALPGERWTDLAGGTAGRWDAGDPYWDFNSNGLRDGPTNPSPPPWRGWTVADNANLATQTAYIADYGEPWTDADLNGTFTLREPFVDDNGNGVRDGGYSRGEMWFRASYDATAQATILSLYATPLYCGETADGRGLDATARLYDLEYVPCPMLTSDSSGAAPFGRDLNDATANVPKNTARWTIELPLARLRTAYQSGPGLNNGDAVDRLLSVETRLGADLSTGAMWPTKNRPENVSKTYCWFHASVNTVPFSERYQFQGDPRHCPYGDTHEYGISYPNGYNWFWDNLQNATNATANWPSLAAARLADLWMGRNAYDTARLMSWMRNAITSCEAVYTTLTGFSYYYLSIGGDVGYDSANGYPSSIPMDGATFGTGGDLFEDTIAGAGTAGYGGSQKFVRSNNGAAVGVRTGGYWWSKPWIGELFQDSAYAGQWAPWGNLRAASGTSALTYRLLRRGDTVAAQQPTGTTLVHGIARTQEEGSTSLFNIGTSSPEATFHHQYADGQTGTLTGDGPQLQSNYNFPIPTTAGISRPFRLNTDSSGGLPPEFSYTTEYPRFSATNVVNFYNHQSGGTGSSLVKLLQPGGARAGYVVVNGIDRTTESGSAFIARYSLLTLIHSFFASGLTTNPNRIKQLPRLGITHPTLVTELNDPSTIDIRWHVDWQRWDGLKYTTAFASGFSEAQTDLVYVALYSRDNGRTWINAKDGSAGDPGVLPLLAGGGGRDPAKTFGDAGPGDEVFTWSTPAGSFPEGSYLIRVEGYRASEPLHYSSHQEKIYVNR
jgi:prepilin-type N-terminal cleavage/methylation domain-containing protein